MVDLTYIEKYILVESTFKGPYLSVEYGRILNLQIASYLHFLIERKLYFSFVFSNIKGRLKQVFRRPLAILLLSRN